MTKAKEQARARAGTLYHSFMRGARAGAACKTLDPAFTEHADPEIRTAYNEGWKAGRDAMANVSGLASALYGYKPSILRTERSLAAWMNGGQLPEGKNDLEGWSDIILGAKR